MNKNLKCPVCQKGTIMFKENLSCECSQCRFECHHGQIERIAAAMELARAHVTIENAMEPLNSGKLKMGEAMPAIRIAMEDVHACEQRVMEVFK